MSEGLAWVVAIFLLVWSIAAVAVPFLIWGIYNQAKRSRQQLDKLADFFDGRNVRLERRPNQ